MQHTLSSMMKTVRLSAQSVAANDDLLLEILARLPAESLVRFKLVSKRWLSLISGPNFPKIWSLNFHPPSFSSGLIFHAQSATIDFISLKKDENQDPIDVSPFRGFTSFPDFSTALISNSCYGLLCFYTYDGSRISNYDYNFHIYNPTTKQLLHLPKQNLDEQLMVDGLYLAFDPLKSLHYKVICVRHFYPQGGFQIHIYSSETGEWRPSGQYGETRCLLFGKGMYWNGAINWIDGFEEGMYFNVEEERVGTMPMITDHEEDCDREDLSMYLGESRGHLHLVEISLWSSSTSFPVYELKEDYSEWFIKYRVDLDALSAGFPEIRPAALFGDDDFMSLYVVCVVREDEDNESFIVMHLPGKILRYNFVDKTCKKVCDAKGVKDKNSLTYDWHDSIYSQGYPQFQYCESFYSI